MRAHTTPICNSQKSKAFQLKRENYEKRKKEGRRKKKEENERRKRLISTLNAKRKEEVSEEEGSLAGKKNKGNRN